MSQIARSPGRFLIVLLCLAVLLAVFGWSSFGSVLRAWKQPEIRAAEEALQTQNIAKATTLFDKVVAADPKDPTVYIDIGQACSAAGQWGLLVRYAERGVQECKYAPNGDRARLYSLLSEGLSQTEAARPQAKTEEAAAHAFQLLPNDAEIMNIYGYTLADNNHDLPLAYSLITRSLKALQKLPDSAEKQVTVAMVEDSYGWVLYRQGRYAEAIDALTQAVSDLDDYVLSSSTMKTVYYHLGAAYRQAGRLEEARNALVISLHYDSNYQPAKDEMNALPAPPSAASTVPVATTPTLSAGK